MRAYPFPSSMSPDAFVSCWWQEHRARLEAGDVDCWWEALLWPVSGMDLSLKPILEKQVELLVSRAQASRNQDLLGVCRRLATLYYWGQKWPGVKMTYAWSMWDAIQAGVADKAVEMAFLRMSFPPGNPLGFRRKAWIENKGWTCWRGWVTKEGGYLWIEEPGNPLAIGLVLETPYRGKKQDVWVIADITESPWEVLALWPRADGARVRESFDVMVTYKRPDIERYGLITPTHHWFINHKTPLEVGCAYRVAGRQFWDAKRHSWGYVLDEVEKLEHIPASLGKTFEGFLSAPEFEGAVVEDVIVPTYCLRDVEEGDWVSGLAILSRTKEGQVYWRAANLTSLSQEYLQACWERLGRTWDPSWPLLWRAGHQKVL